MTRLASTSIARVVTDEEVEFFRENGWVKLDQLISSDLAAELLASAKSVLDSVPPKRAEFGSFEIEYIGPESDRVERVHDSPTWRDYYFPSSDNTQFRDVCMSPDLGLAVQRLFGRKIGAQYVFDILICKYPSDDASSGKGRTYWHQDLPGSPFDRKGSMVCWIALNDVTPENGSMRFLSGSHKEGPLGVLFGEDEDTLSVHPDLTAKYNWSEPLTLKPGDATFHDGYTIHGAPPNQTSGRRFGWTCAYTPSDTKYNGAPWHAGKDLKQWDTLPEDRYPVIYR